MDLILLILLFIGSIFVHELTHILIAWYYNRQAPVISINKLNIKITPKAYLTNEQKKKFLGYPIITGMIFIAFYIFTYPTEGYMVLIAYLLSSGTDFYNLILLEIKK